MSFKGPFRHKLCYDFMHWGNPKHKYRQGRELIDNNPEEKDLGVLVEEKLNVTQQYVFAAWQANHILGSIKRTMTSRSREVILPVCSALVRPHLEYCVQLWGFKHKKGTDLLDQAPRRATKMEHLSHEERMFSLEKRRLWRDLISAFQHMKGAYKKAGEGLFGRAWSDRTRSSGFKLKEGRFKSGIRKKFFAMRVVRHWNRFPREALDAPSVEVFKARLYRALSNLV